MIRWKGLLLFSIASVFSYTAFSQTSNEHEIGKHGISNRYLNIHNGDTTYVIYCGKMFGPEDTTKGGIVTAQIIRNLPTKNINALVTTTASLPLMDKRVFEKIVLKGKVVGKTGYGISGVLVGIIESGVTVQTDRFGHYEIDVSQKFNEIGMVNLKVSKNNYRSEFLRINKRRILSRTLFTTLKSI